MTYEDIKKVNGEIKKIDIRGKMYAEVAQRVTAFRKLHPNGDIQTRMISFENGVCVFCATVLDGDGRTLATGHAYEKESNGNINKTCCIENCETSAVGRALGFCGFGSEDSIASVEEMRKAPKDEEVNNNLSIDLISEAQELGIEMKKVAAYYKKKVAELTNDELMNAIEQKKIFLAKKAEGAQ